MLISKKVIRECNEEGKFEFTHIETGQGFVLLTLENYLKLEVSEPK